MTREVLAIAAASAATAFSFDLMVAARRRHRAHVWAFAAGVAMLTIAGWALVVGLVQGWTLPVYRMLHLFGGIVAVPMLAVGSTFLVVGRRAGNVALVVAAAFAATAAALTATTGATNPLTGDGIPPEVFGGAAEGFGPALFALAGGPGGAALMTVLVLVSVARFWRRNRRVVAGNALVALGAVTAAAGGAPLWGNAGIRSTSFEAASLLAAALIWAGYRVTRGGRPAAAPLPTVTLAGPSIENPERAHVEVMIGALERAGYRVICPARDIEDWGNVGYTPEEANRRTCRAIDQSGAVVVDLHHGYGVVSAGYAYARNVPVIMAAPEGSRIARPLRGVATAEVYYRSVDDVVDRLAQILPPGPAPLVDRVPEPA